MGDPPPDPPELSGAGLTLSARSKDKEELATILRVREPVGPPSVSTCSILMLGFCACVSVGWGGGGEGRGRHQIVQIQVMDACNQY